MIARSSWTQVSPPRFEELALEHVRDIYPSFVWRSTSQSADDGRDGIGELESIEEGISEIYWMEAKHYPARSSIGKYTLDTHLVSAFFSRNVQRLHVVTSGSLSDNFIIRANDFSHEHGFHFAYTDRDVLEAWLWQRADVVQRYFGEEADSILTLLNTNPHPHPQFARALVLPENDTPSVAPLQLKSLLPGRKFRLVVMLSRASHLPTPLNISWDPPQDRVSLLASLGPGQAISQDLAHQTIISVPFRLLRYGSDPLPNPVLTFGEGQPNMEARLPPLRDLPRLTSPFVGKEARAFLISLKRLLREEVAAGNPGLVVCRGRAGAGKTRLAQELRDDAQSLGFNVRLIEMISSPAAQEERWRLLFRWLMGIEHNPFCLSEDRLLQKYLSRLDPVADEGTFPHDLRDFLFEGKFSEDLFNLDLPAGRRMRDAVRLSLSTRLTAPTLVHVEDAHHLSRRQLRPLFLLRHLIETLDGLPLCVVTSSRNDETVVDSSFAHFVEGLQLSGFKGLHILDVPDLGVDDARELVIGALRLPELLADGSRTLDLIIERSGRNPFLLTQVINHLAIDCEAVSFGVGPHGFLVNIEAFKAALADLPTGAARILSERLAGLVARGERDLLTILAAIAVVGRRASRTVIERATTKRIRGRKIERLFRYGYLRDASTTHLELEHDLLREALQKHRDTRLVAAKLAASLSRDPHAGLSDDEEAAIYFAAGARYYKRSWHATTMIIERRSSRQEYLGLPPLIDRLTQIATRVPGLALTARLHWLAAISDQHSGNTYRALVKFQEIKDSAARSLPSAIGIYIEASIEIGNQYLLRCEPAKAFESLSAGLALLQEPLREIASAEHSRLSALGRNRLGAVLHLMAKLTESNEQYELALMHAKEGGAEYLRAHTYWDLAVLHRFHNASGADSHLREARRLWSHGLRDKERLRLMLDCSEAYSQCLIDDSLINRWRLRAIAAENSEKGYPFQATSALLCAAYCALLAGRWSEAREALFRTIDLAVIAENRKHRAFAICYLTVCAYMLGAELEARDWARQAIMVLADDGLRSTELYRCAQLYSDALAPGADPSLMKMLRQGARASWPQYDRA